MTKTRIMVVEDEGIVALNIQGDLEALGYDVPVVAASGEEAVEGADRVRPDLVLMDIVLEDEMDGVEAAEQIQELFDIPVVFLTALADEKTLQRVKMTAPYGYLLKPFDERELHVAIEVALQRHKTEKALRPGDTAVQPDEKAQRQEMEASVPEEVAVEKEPSVPTESTVLLIEDDALSASVVELTLTSEGYQVLTASNGLQGLKMARSAQPNLILLDLMLPGMDGFEVLSELRADPKTASVPVAIISAKGQAEDRQLADRLGADAYLPKAYERDELLELVQSLLGAI